MPVLTQLESIRITRTVSLVRHRYPAKEEADRGEKVHLHGNGSPSDQMA